MVINQRDDTSERRFGEEALLKSEERWRRVFENSAIGVALSTTQGRFMAGNLAYQRMLGYTEEELCQLSFLEITHEDDRARNAVLIAELLEGSRQQFQIEKRYRRKDGQLIWVSNNVSLVPGTESHPQFLMAIVEDISERKRLQGHLELERDRLRLLLDLTKNVLSHLDLLRLCRAMAVSIRRVMHCDFAALALPDFENDRLRLYAFDSLEGRTIFPEGMTLPIIGTPAGLAFRTGQPQVFDAAGLAQFDEKINPGLAAGLKSGCFIPLVNRERVLGTMDLCRYTDSPFTSDDVDFLSEVAGQVAIAVGNALEYDEVSKSRERLAEENLYLEHQLRTEHNFGEIVGKSPALKSVLKQIEIVATTDATVLIHGETGTGKELVARAIHNHSNRASATFVKVNCAAIPLGLLESEWFGHEKGAFTGAIGRKIGRFELADKGTLFLDEIGEIPLELQPKLLRVLQEQEFERLGSTRTIKTDARLVAATNRDLGRMIEERKFRDDLYYRLNIFPITVPPLRERTQDIPLLVSHFVDKYAVKMNKRIDEISGETMEALTRYHWPGNVRELQNVIERAVVLTQDTVLRVVLPELQSPVMAPPSALKTLEHVERAHIIQTLDATNWVIGGPHGAAEHLGLKRTTLRSRMEKFGITRPLK
jgi:formate hydrogenlyase transcriptional activator